MKLNSESRTRFSFHVQHGLTWGADGIDVKEGIASFPKDVGENKGKDWKLFSTPEECIAWWDANMPIKSAGGKTKKLYDVQTSKSAASELDFSLIKKFMVNPDRFKPEDILVYRSFLINNFADRSRERFTLETIKTLNQTIVGKSKMFDHARSAEAVFARYFKSEIVSMTADECLGMLQEKVSKKQERFIRMAADIDGGIKWMVPSFYFLTKYQNTAELIDAGILFFESISIRCRNMREYRDPESKDVVLWMEYFNTDEDEAEALEGSYVWLGAQHGAGTRKSFDMDGGMTHDKALTAAANEHVAVLSDSKEFSWFEETEKKVKEKSYSVIVGHRPDGTSDDYQFRYPADKWSTDEARKHCEAQGGTFEEAKSAKEDEAAWESDLEEKAQWSAAQINTFEDNCFAVVEPTGKKNDAGQTIPLNARHLPHHAKGNGASGTGGTVDLPHLRNALARMNQIKPVTDKIGADELKRKAESHLVAHAKKLKIGDYGKTNGGSMKLKLLTIDKEYALDDEGAEQLTKDLTEAVGALETRAKTAEDAVAVVKSVFGEFTADTLKVAKEAVAKSERLHDRLVNEAVSMSVMLGQTENKEEAVKAQAAAFKILDLDALETQIKSLRTAIDKKYPPSKKQLSDDERAAKDLDPESLHVPPY